MTSCLLVKSILLQHSKLKLNVSKTRLIVSPFKATPYFSLLFSLSGNGTSVYLIDQGIAFLAWFIEDFDTQALDFIRIN